MVTSKGTGELCLTRKRGEQIELPDLGVTITTKRIGQNRVLIGVMAPRNVRILRSELMEEHE